MPRKAEEIEIVTVLTPKTEIIYFPPKTWIPVNAFFAAIDQDRPTNNGR